MLGLPELPELLVGISLRLHVPVGWEATVAAEKLYQHKEFEGVMLVIANLVRHYCTLEGVVQQGL